MAVNPDLALLEHTRSELSTAHRNYANLLAEHETLKEAEKSYRKEIEALKRRSKATFTENRLLSKELQHRSLLVPESFLEALKAKVEWGEYLEEAEERSLIISLPDHKLEERIEHAVNVMLGLCLPVATPSPEPEVGIKLRAEDRDELAKVLHLNPEEFETKEEGLALVEERRALAAEEKRRALESQEF